jgi:hypothetical protein
LAASIALGGEAVGQRERLWHVATSIRKQRTLGAAQYFVLAALVLWTLTEIGCALLAVLAPPPRFGFGYDGARIVSIEAGSPAQLAGLRVGDTILLQRLSAAERDRLAGARPAQSPLTVAFQVKRNGAIRTVPVTSAAQSAPTQVIVAEFGVVLETLVFVGIGTALVLLRPAPATWSFFLLSVGYPIVQFGQLRSFLDPAFLDADAWALGLALALTVWGAVSFWLDFPDDKPAAWLVRLVRALQGGAAIAGVLFALTYARLTGAYRPNVVQSYEALLIAILIANIVLILKRQPEDAEGRARSRWVVTGAIASIGGIALETALRLAHVPGFNGSPLDVLLALSPVLMPLSVAYAVLRQRVIDVRFAINRALVYGAFTTVLVVVFSLAEFLVGKLEAGRVAQNIELIAAIVVGFSFNLAHRRIEGYFERVFFRSQHEAAARLRRVAAAIPYAETAETIDGFLVREPLEAYALLSATLYRREDSGDFQRVAGSGWSSGPAEVAAADPLVAFLSSERETLDLDTGIWPAVGTAEDAPILAVPISVRNVISGFVCYGPSASGEAFDPGERRLLRELAGAAAAAYAHLTAVELRREVTRLRGALEAQGAFIAP